MEESQISLNAATGSTDNNLFRQEKIQQESRQEHNDNCGKHSTVLAGIFHCVDNLQQTDTNRVIESLVVKINAMKNSFHTDMKLKIVTVIMAG